jgi:hypothetical protein
MDRDTTKFIKDLKMYRGEIPKQVLKTLRGQALSGDVEGAKKGLKKITKEVSR